MGAAMTITTSHGENGGVELAAIGELDLSTIDAFTAALRAAAEDAGPGRTMTLDLSGVAYLDSAAINALFAQAGRINVVVVHPLLMRGLTISGLDRVVEVRAAIPE